MICEYSFECACSNYGSTCSDDGLDPSDCPIYARMMSERWLIFPILSESDIELLIEENSEGE